jgi:GR25 family glycosyltransferase involved in LPS biosynthesis
MQAGPITAGEIGLWCSHVKIWQDILKLNYSKVLVLEDDIKILDIKNFKNKLENYTINLPETFDIGYIALIKYLPNTLLKTVTLSVANEYVNAFDSNFEARGTFGMIYSKKAAETLLSYETYTDAIDAFLWNIAINEDYQSPLLPRMSQGLLEIYESSIEIIGLADLGSDITAMGRDYS